jgi:flagellar protein FliO/FliZ
MNLLRQTGAVILLCQAKYALATTDKTNPLQGPMSGESVTTVGTGQYLQMLLALVFVISLIFMVAWLIRRMGSVPGATKGSLKVLAGVSLGQRERVVLMQAGKMQLLLGVAPGQIRTLHVFDEPVIEIDAQAEPTRFADKLNAMIKQRMKQ